MHRLNRFIRTPEGIALGLLLFAHALAAFFSYGFHHPDEHYQILEFANYWVGLVPDASGLPWEFAAQIRPWFQPMLHGVAMKFALLINLYNPFTLVYLFRLAYAGLNVWVMWALWIEFKKRYQLNPIWFLWISLIWFFPYIHVRTSSENLAGIFLSFAFVLYLRNRSLFWIGILFGLSFISRFQVALGIFGFGLFLLFKDRKITKQQILLFVGFLLPVGLGFLLDRLGYGNWVFTPYRYFKVNLVDGVAATFNPYPWYQYFIWILQLNPFVSIPLFAGCVLYFKRTRIDGTSAFVIAFFVLHLLITNKEYRFLFPILNLVPFLAAVGLQSLTTVLQSKRNLGLYTVINFIAFSVSTLRGASVEKLWAMQVVNRYATPGEIWLSNRNYQDDFLRGYYRLPEHHIILFHDGAELESELQTELKTRPDVHVLVDGHLVDQPTQSMLATIKRHHCQMLTSARPAVIFKFREIFPAVDRLSFKAVYRCR